MRIAATWQLEPFSEQLLRERLADHDLLTFRNFSEPTHLNEIRSIDVLIAGVANRKIIESCPNLKLIHSYISGAGHIDLHCANALGIPVCSAKGFNAVSVAEHVIMFLLCLLRSPARLDRQVRAGQWNRNEDFSELEQKTLAIIGLGKVGAELAKRAKAFNMRVLAVRRRPSLGDNDIGVDFLGGPEFIDEIGAQADFVSVNVPATRETIGLFSTERLAAMRRGVIFVNVSRGQVVNLDALHDMLKCGHLRAAGLDVFNPEPPDISHPIFALENVIVSPHVAGRSRESEFRRVELILENVNRLARKEPLMNLVDPELGY